jgi:hypothetical protein
MRTRAAFADHSYFRNQDGIVDPEDFVANIIFVIIAVLLAAYLFAS